LKANYGFRALTRFDEEQDSIISTKA